VTEGGHQLGVAFDGDGDRAIFVDERGRVVDGDAVMLMCARQLRVGRAAEGQRDRRDGDEQHRPRAGARDLGIELVRCQVGDKYVMEEMIAAASRSAASSRVTSSSPSTSSPATG
jgi:phosphoglucosamine mutase